MTSLISLLNNDSALTTIIGANRIFPDYVNDKSACIVYSFYPTSNDGIKKTYRLTLRIIAPTLTICDNIENRISADILTRDDTKLTTTILKVVQNGGGNLKDPDTGLQHRILYYDVLGKA